MEGFYELTGPKLGSCEDLYYPHDILQNPHDHSAKSNYHYANPCESIRQCRLMECSRYRPLFRFDFLMPLSGALVSRVHNTFILCNSCVCVPANLQHRLGRVSVPMCKNYCTKNSHFKYKAEESLLYK
jgi:hypothetical protein